MNVLLVYPEARGVFFNLRHMLRMVGKKAHLPPLGLLTAAGMLPRRWGKRFVDLHVRRPTDEELRWADYAFVTITAGGVQDASATDVIARCKAAGLDVVVGGPGLYRHEAAFERQRACFPQVDHFLIGEAEATLPHFLRDLESGGPKPVYRSEGWTDPRQSPTPMWELLDLDDYAEMPMQLVRGCAYDCDFCVVPAVMGRPGRAKGVDQFLGELQHIYEVGWRGGIELNDDNLIADIKYAKREVLPAVAEWQREHGMPFRFHVCVDARVGEDDELLRLLWESGFHSLFLGIENLNAESLAEVHKRVNRNRDMDEVVRRIHRAGILTYSGFMVGFDHDDPAVFDQMLEFIQRNGIVMPSLTKVNAVPGAALYERLSEAGRLDSAVVPGVAHRSNVRGVPMGDQLRDQGYARLMQNLWEPRSFYARARHALREFPSEVHGQRPRLQDIVMLLRILFFAGIAGRERVELWKFLRWTVANRPELLGAALSVVPVGYGFRRRAEEVFGRAPPARKALWSRARRVRESARERIRGGNDVRAQA